MKLNEKPYEILGFASEDYIKWCKTFSKRKDIVDNKKEFFKLIYDKRLEKHDEKLFLDGVLLEDYAKNNN